MKPINSISDLPTIDHANLEAVCGGTNFSKEELLEWCNHGKRVNPTQPDFGCALHVAVRAASRAQSDALSTKPAEAK